MRLSHLLNLYNCYTEPTELTGGMEEFKQGTKWGLRIKDCIDFIVRDMNDNGWEMEDETEEPWEEIFVDVEMQEIRCNWVQIFQVLKHQNNTRSLLLGTMRYEDGVIKFYGLDTTKAVGSYDLINMTDDEVENAVWKYVTSNLNFAKSSKLTTGKARINGAWVTTVSQVVAHCISDLNDNRWEMEDETGEPWRELKGSAKATDNNNSCDILISMEGGRSYAVGVMHNNNGVLTGYDVTGEKLLATIDTNKLNADYVSDGIFDYLYQLTFF